MLNLVYKIKDALLTGILDEWNPNLDCGGDNFWNHFRYCSNKSLWVVVLEVEVLKLMVSVQHGVMGVVIVPCDGELDTLVSQERNDHNDTGNYAPQFFLKNKENSGSEVTLEEINSVLLEMYEEWYDKIFEEIVDEAHFCLF